MTRTFDLYKKNLHNLIVDLVVFLVSGESTYITYEMDVCKPKDLLDLLSPFDYHVSQPRTVLTSTKSLSKDTRRSKRWNPSQNSNQKHCNSLMKSLRDSRSKIYLLTQFTLAFRFSTTSYAFNFAKIPIKEHACATLHAYVPTTCNFPRKNIRYRETPRFRVSLSFVSNDVRFSPDSFVVSSTILEFSTR